MADIDIFSPLHDDIDITLLILPLIIIDISLLMTLMITLPLLTLMPLIITLLIIDDIITPHYFSLLIY
jgi:hypothetical protein